MLGVSGRVRSGFAVAGADGEAVVDRLYPAGDELRAVGVVLVMVSGLLLY